MRLAGKTIRTLCPTLDNIFMLCFLNYFQVVNKWFSCLNFSYLWAWILDNLSYTKAVTWFNTCCREVLAVKVTGPSRSSPVFELNDEIFLKVHISWQLLRDELESWKTLDKFFAYLNLRVFRQKVFSILIKGALNLTWIFWRKDHLGLACSKALPAIFIWAHQELTRLSQSRLYQAKMKSVK